MQALGRKACTNVPRPGTGGGGGTVSHATTDPGSPDIPGRRPSLLLSLMPRPFRSGAPKPAALLLLLLAGAAPALHAQEARRAPNQLSLTAHVGGLTVGYARGVAPDRLVGGELGIGGDWTSVMLLGGRHFGEWIAYEERDAAGDEQLFELGHVGIFVRGVESERWEWDAGARASAFLHFDESDDDPGGGLFVGVYGTLLVGWSRVKLGPRVQVGLFSEGSGTNELGVYLAPLTGRVTFGW